MNHPVYDCQTSPGQLRIRTGGRPPVLCLACGIILICRKGRKAYGAQLSTGTFPEAVKHWMA